MALNQSDPRDHMISPQDPIALEILAQRAKELSDPGEAHEDISVTITCLKFIIAKENYAIDLNRVTGVHALTELTPIPCAPEFVKGVVRVRGRIVSAIDLRLFFGLPRKGITDLSKLVIVENQALEVGILADQTIGAIELALDDMQPANVSLTAIEPYFLRGVTRERMAIIHADALLSHERLIVNDEMNV